MISQILLWSAYDTIFWQPNMPRISTISLAVKKYVLSLTQRAIWWERRERRKMLGESGRKLPCTKTPLNFYNTAACYRVFLYITIITSLGVVWIAQSGKVLVFIREVLGLNPGTDHILSVFRPPLVEMWTLVKKLIKDGHSLQFACTNWQWHTQGTWKEEKV